MNSEGRTNAGTTPVTVTFGYAKKPDFENYIVPDPITLDLTVNKIAQNASITIDHLL